MFFTSSDVKPVTFLLGHDVETLKSHPIELLDLCISKTLEVNY